MKPLSQKDPRWAQIRIGRTNLQMWRWGCVITCLAMALGVLQDRFVSPPDGAKYWEFNGRGEILWDKSRFNGMNFLKRYYGNDFKKISEYAMEEGKAVIAEVNNGAHWVYVRRMEQAKYVIWDPIDGREYIGLPSKYKITGFATFERSYMKPSPWMSEAWAKAKARGLNEEDPLMKVGLRDIVGLLHELKIIDKLPQPEEMTVGWFLVVIEKIKNRW